MDPEDSAPIYIQDSSVTPEYAAGIYIDIFSSRELSICHREIIS